MPKGKTHDKITINSAPFVGYAALLITKDIKLSLISFISYIFAGLMFSGDLDIDSKQKKRWLIFSFIWIPYSKIFKHRSFFTHGIFIATLIRLLYLELWILLFISILHRYGVLNNLTPFKQLEILKNYICSNKEQSIIIFFSLSFGSFIHSWSDYIFSKIKKVCKRIIKPYYLIK